MKKALVLSVTLLMVLQAMPVTVAAQETAQIFSLPEGSVGKPYRANIEGVLRDNYGMRLQSEARVALFRWAFASGEIPPGLALTPNGTLLGIPRMHREADYRFMVKVSDVAVSMSAPLYIEFNLKINMTQVRLVTAARPKLVRDTTRVPDVSERPFGNHISAVGPDKRSAVLSTSFFATGAANRSNTANNREGFLGDKTGREASTDVVAESAPAAASYDPGADNVRDRFLKKGANGAGVDASKSVSTNESGLSNSPAVTTACAECTRTACPVCDLPPGDEKRRLEIDARGGFKGDRKFKKGQNVQVVIKNKNPYIKQYKTEITETTVEETALTTFVPLLIGNLSDVGKTEDKSAEKAANAKAAVKATDCSGEITELETEIRDGIRIEGELRSAYEALAKEHKSILEKYESGREILRNPRIECAELYQASCTLRRDLEGAVGESQIKFVQDKIEELEAQAIIVRAKARKLQKNPNCNSDFVDEALITADGLLARVRAANTNLKKITDDNATFEKTIKVIDEATADDRNFLEVHEIPKSRSTDKVTINLTAKNLKTLGGEPEDKSHDIVSVEVQFGDAPYFAISGGIAVSTLERTEFQRVQGFATDRQGNVVGTELTSIVGIKEDSSTRISPLLMLHGRLFRPKEEGILSGIHWSLGITGKNDNKGTDIEYLVGPSFSFLNDQAFFTIGGYAGKRQSLEGNLFPGAEVPKDLAEIPVRKNYHWKLGFGLTYRIPLPK